MCLHTYLKDTWELLHIEEPLSVYFASDKDDDGRYVSESPLSCPEAQSSAQAVETKGLAMESSNCHEVKQSGRLSSAWHPIAVAIPFHSLLQFIEVGGSLLRRSRDPTGRRP